MNEEWIQPAARIKRLPPYLFGRINDLKYKLRQEGKDIIDLGMGNPSDPTPAPIVDKLCEAVRDVRNQRYSMSRGVYNLRRDVAQYYERHHEVSLDPNSEVIATIGSKEGFSHLMLGIMGPGDTALVPNPAFTIHIYAVALAGGNVISVPLGQDEAFLERIDYLAGHLYPKPKVLMLNYPHNPTTMVVENPDFFPEIVKLAKKHQFMVVHDFAYSELVFDGYKAPSFLATPGAKDVGVEFTTMSKTYNMAGWRIGYCAGNRKMIETLSTIKGYYDYGIFQAIQIASIIALRTCDKEVEKQRNIYQKRRDVLCERLQNIGWEVEKPKGTMFVWAKFPEAFQEMGSVDFAMKLLKEAEVAVAPGRAFGEHGEGYLRLALVENEQRLRQAVRQISRVSGG